MGGLHFLCLRSSRSSGGGTETQEMQSWTLLLVAADRGLHLRTDRRNCYRSSLYVLDQRRLMWENHLRVT